MTEQPTSIGPFRIIDQLTSGGSGVIYRAVHRQTGEPAALKSVRLARSGLLESIRREIHALAGIRHPGIVRVIDHGVERGLPWYAMEMLAGLTLREWSHSQEQPVPLSRVLTVIYRLCSPLAYLHGEGIVHRDLKPDNVLVRPDGRPVILDFGLLAQFGGELSREVLAVDPGVAGTLRYMAPEQILGKLVDARTDLYSLGCILYELLTGQPPFKGRLPMQLFSAHLHETPRPPVELNLSIPTELNELVLRLLTKDRRDRPGYADDVAATLIRLGAKDETDVGAPRPRPYLYRPGLTGRESQLDSLRLHLKPLQEGTGGLVLLSGESGVGKTRLAMELARDAYDAKIMVMTGECQQSGGQPLEALRKALQAIADHCRERGPAETERVLGARAKILAAYEPALAGLPDLDTYPEPVTLDPVAARHRLFGYLIQTLTTLTTQQPLLLILDDLQWADDLVIGFLEQVARSSAEEQMPILVVGAYRPEEASDALQILGMLGGPSLLTIDRLDQDSVAEMASDMLGLTRTPASLSRYLYRHSNGNPFFVAEYLRTAVVEGLLWRDGMGSWQVADAGGAAVKESDFEALPLPGSLRDLVSQRFQGLSPVASRIVFAAAVAGREVEVELVKAMTQVTEVELMEALDELSRRQLLALSESGALRFHHTQIQEVAYQSQSEDELEQQHRLAVEAIKSIWSDELAPHAAELAVHSDRSGAVAEAAEWYLQAGKRAAGQYAAAESLTYLSRSLELVAPDQSVVRFEILLVREKVYATKGERDAQRQDLAVLAKLAGDLDDKQKQAEVALRQAGYALDTSDYDSALAMSQQTIDLAKHVSESGLAAAGHLLWGQGLWRQGDLNSARAQIERALNLAEGAGDRQVEADSLRILGNVSYYQGNYPQAVTYWQKALPNSCEIGDRVGEASILSNLGEVARAIGDYTRASDYYEQRLLICREIGDRAGESIALANLGLVSHNLGDNQAAQDYSHQMLRIAQEIGNRTHQGYALCNLGHALTGLGEEAAARSGRDSQEARQLFGSATDAYGLSVAVRRELNELFLVMESLSGLADVSLRSQDLPLAQRQVDEILAFLQESNLDGTEEPLRIYLTCYRVLAAADDPRAESTLSTAHELLEERVAKIPEQMRFSYLESVAAHREIVQEMSGLTKS
jgi:tetratricopeptide (TPR) repeat protein